MGIGIVVVCAWQCEHAGLEIDMRGELISHHFIDTSWSLQNEVLQLRAERWSWQEIMWRLWGACFTLKCEFTAQLVLLSRLDPERDVVKLVNCNEQVSAGAHFPMKSSESGMHDIGSERTCDNGKATTRKLYGTHSDACSLEGKYWAYQIYKKALYSCFHKYMYECNIWTFF